MPAAYDRLPLGALRVFEAVAPHLRFCGAAEALHVTPAAVSQQIKVLESYIQVPVFRRSWRMVEITEEGTVLLPAVRAGLDKLESAMHQIKQYGRAGPLQISLLTSFLQIWLLPRIRSFRRKCPEIELQFHTSRELLDDWIVPVGNPELVEQYGMIERGRRRPRLCVGTLDRGYAVTSQRHPAIRQYQGVTLQLRLLFCLPEAILDASQNGAISRLDRRRHPGLQGPHGARLRRSGGRRIGDTLSPCRRPMQTRVPWSLGRGPPWPAIRSIR